MKVKDLINLLEEYPEDSEIRIAIQPTWPLAFEIHGICGDEDLETDEDSDQMEDDESKVKRVWIVTSDHHPYNENPYAPSELWDVARRH